MTQDISSDDYAQILNHMGYYCHCIDGGEPENWASCYTEDGVFDGPATPEPVKGRPGLAAFAKATYDNSNGGKMRHFVGNLTGRYGKNRDELICNFYNYVTTYVGDGKPTALMALCEG